jgi:broad specificity phosphatase PhoE
MPTKHLKKLAGALALASLSLTAQAGEAVLDVYLARHGQTAWNLEKRLQGATDNALNDTGKAQARQLGEKLKGVSFSAVYASSLARARETATLAVPDVAPTPLPALAERSFGKFEGMFEDGRDGALAEEFKRRASDPDDGLDGGESLNSQARRVATAVEQIRHKQTQGSVLVVSHGGVTPLIMAHLLQLPASEAAARIKQANDEVYLVRLRGQQAPQVWKLIGKESLEQL